MNVLVIKVQNTGINAKSYYSVFGTAFQADKVLKKEILLNYKSSKEEQICTLLQLEPVFFQQVA